MNKFEMVFTEEELDIIEHALDVYIGSAKCDANNYTECQLQQKIAEVLFTARHTPWQHRTGSEGAEGMGW